MAENDKKLEFTEFRPYEEREANLPPPNKGNTSNIQINVGNTRIVFQKTPPTPKKLITNTQPKKIPRMDSWSGRGQGSVSASISQVSAVGMTTGSLPVSVQQSHRSLVEEQMGMKMSSKLSTDRHWMPDKLCHQCSECEVKFSFITRRHHCRICGRIFCNSCSNNSIPGHHLRPPIQGKVRVCSACLAIFFEMHTSQSNADVNQAVPVTPSARGRSHSVSSDRQDSPERLDSISAMSFNPSMSMVQSRVSWDDGSVTDADIISSPSRLSSIGIEFDNPTPLRHGPKRRMSKDENILALQEDEIDVRLQEIWSKFTDKTVGLAPQTRRHRFGIRAFQNAYIAQEIVDWLIENKHAYTRVMAIRIGQTFIDTKYLTVVSSPEQVFRDSKDQILEIDESGTLSPLATSPTLIDAPNWFLSDEGGDDSGSSHDPYHRGSVNEAKVDVESGQAMFQKCIPSQSQLNIQPGNLFNPPPKHGSLSPPVILHLDEADEDYGVSTENGEPANKSNDNESFFVQNYFSKDDVATPTMDGCLFPPAAAINQPTNPTMTSYSVLTPNSVLQAFPLTQASHFAGDSEGVSIQSEIKQQHISEHQIHLEKFLTQQLISFSLSLSWLEYIQPLILEASRKVSTHVLTDDFMDFESYCKVKKIPGGRKASCSFIHGAVFSKHVSHKKMDLSLRNPRILMLKCAMEFQRRENQMSSFDTLMLQEQEYLKNLVERVKTFQPDIILVQKSVARFALEMFHHHRIVVVVNIKPSVMARVARSTEGDLLSNLDQLYFNVKLGTCGRFYVRTYTLPDSSRKTLMYFDECEPKLGGVILLQGTDNQELKKVKKVVKFGLQIAHNMKLESAFLTDEFAVSSKKVSSKCTMAEDYVTPPASPELYFYPFSTTMFDEPTKNNPPEDILTDDEDKDVTEEENRIDAIDSMEDLELENESVSEGMTEAVCPIPVPVNETEVPLLVTEDDSNEVDGEKQESTSTIISEQLEPSMVINTGGSSTGSSAKSSESVFLSILESHLMSTSPHVMFKVPYLQREQNNHAHIKMYLPEVVYWSHWFRPRAKHIPMDSLVHSAYLRKKSMQAMAAANGKEHTYKSVSSHPFVKSTFLHSANSDEIKSALADFRARASHPDEPNCFFFPSARKATDTATQLQKIFAKSKLFEEKAKNYHLVQKKKLLTINPPVEIEGKQEEGEPSATNSDPHLSKRTTRWTVPEKEAHRPLTPVKKHPPEQFPIIPEPEPEPVVDAIDFSKVFEGDKGRGTPEPAAVLIAPPTVTTDASLNQSDKELGMMSDEQIDCLDPFNHQSISLVFSSTCHDKTKHLYPCVPPCIIPMSYYGRNDIPFGEFLHRYCFRENYICQSCNVDMSTHQRHFVHGGAELRITMQQLGASIPGGDKSIFTWSTCTQCRKQSTPLVPLSIDSLHFSFAKFLELKFYANNYNCFNFNEDGPPKCTHPIHSYVQFFSYQDKVATFELFPVEIFEVRMPLQNIQLNPSQVVHHDYFREISHLSKLIESVFYHMKKYVEVYNIDPLQERTKKTMDRFLGMRDMLRMKVKQLKDLSVDCGLSRYHTGEKGKDNFSTLQDSLAELKRSLADTVDCFNKDLYEVDCKLREMMAKKDPSPRDTPLSAAAESESSPKSSPRLAQKQADKSSKVNSTSSDETKDTKLLDRPQILRHHRRQYSDSAAVCKVSESSKDDTDTGSMGNRNGSDNQLSLSGDRDDDLIPLDKSMCSSSSSSFEACEEDGGELVSAVRESVNSDTVMAVVYSTQEIMTKIRGKDIEDPNKFYHLRSTTISSSHTASGDFSDWKGNQQSSKKVHNATTTSKLEDLDSNSNSGGGIKSKISSDKLTSLLSKPFQKLPTPFEGTEHHLLRGKLRFQISVYENEPTSIIAFALCSREYAHELKLLVEEARKIGLSESVVMQTTPRGSEGDVQTNPAKPAGFIKNVISEIRKKKLQSSVSVTSPQEDAPLEASHGLEQSGTLGDDPINIQWNGVPDTSDRFSSSHEQKHISLEFADDTTKFFCKAYYAEEFRKLRELLHLEGDDSYIRSLARCVRYEAKGGKSKSMFLKTFEDQLIMKQVQLVEITSFIEIAPEYFKHVTDAITEKRPMVLAKILGAYSIGFRNTKTGRSKRHNVIIMENLLYNHKCSKVFDLKGSMRGRYVMQDPKKDGKGDVLMDENFLEFVYTDPVYVRPHAKAVLMQAIISDTLFLSKNSIMDYSLLTGLDEEKGELVVGIIDFVRPFTLDKRLEMIFKKTGRSVLPTVVYPDLYQKRFIDAMDRYFSPIPDKWTGLGADIRVSY